MQNSVTPAVSLIPLNKVSPGDIVELMEIHGGRRLRKRLADLGLNIGVSVHVLQAARLGGPILLAFKDDARLAIGQGIASRILVAPQREIAAG